MSYLDLGHNFLTGTIPRDFSVLGALGALGLSMNYLTMGQLTTLPVIVNINSIIEISDGDIQSLITKVCP